MASLLLKLCLLCLAISAQLTSSQGELAYYLLLVQKGTPFARTRYPDSVFS